MRVIVFALFVVGAFACDGTPPPITNGQWPADCVNGTLGVTSCTALCNVGFTALPIPTVTCTAAGVWTVSPEAGACVRACNGTPPALTNGLWGTNDNANCADTIANGGVCVGQCAQNFVGSPTIACRGGSWAVQQGKCVPAAGACLGPAPPVANGQVPATCQDAANGEVCAYTCNGNAGTLNLYGPTVAGGVTSTCTDGQWDPPTGQCVAVCKTSTLTTPANVTWPNDCANTPVGGMCTGTCTGGSTGVPQAACLSNVNVPGATFVVTSGCSAATGTVCTTQDPTVVNAPTPTQCVNVPSGSVCSYTCNAGSHPYLTYAPDVATGVTSTCTAGTWSAASGKCIQVCRTSTLPTLAGVTWPNNCAGTAVGTTCAGTWASGAGVATATCTSEGFVVTQSSCAAQGTTICPSAPVTPVNAKAAPECAGKAVGESCTFTCNGADGGAQLYAPIPAGTTVTSTCQAGGTWTTPTSACLQVCRTDSLTTPPNVTWTNGCVSTRVGSTCTGTCPAGMTGAPLATCSTSLGVSTPTFTVTGGCSAAPAPGAVCATVPSSVTNAVAPTNCKNTPSGGVCTYTCNTGVSNNIGYAPSVATGVTRACSNGVWSSTVSGACVQVCKSAPPTLTNGVWPSDCANTPVRSASSTGICAGTCNTGFFGTPQTTCQSGTPGGFTALASGCTATRVCAGVPTVTVTNGQWPASCVNTAAGSACTIVCNTGYASTSPAKVQCVSNNANTVTGANWATSATGSACVRVGTGRKLV